MEETLFWFSLLPVTWSLVWSILQLFFMFRPQKVTKALPNFQVIICARNEAQRLKKYIPLWLAQDYPRYTVVLADDASDDETVDLAAKWGKQFAHFRYIRKPEKTRSGKRDILSYALADAKEGQIVLSDADCWPTDQNFLKSLAKRIGDRPVVYVGFGHYAIEQFWPGILVHFETIHAARQYMLGAWLGFSYMGVGRNMGYPRDWGLAAVEASRVGGLNSGDDDMAIQRGSPVRVMPLDFSGAVTYSEAPVTWKNWLNQKHRHMSTSIHYPFKVSMYLGMNWLSSIVVKVFLVCGLLGILSFSLFLLCLSVYVVEIVLLFLWTFRYDKKNTRKWLPLADFLYTFVIPLVWLTKRKKLKNQNRWD